ncbi:MAG: hypothetical protein ACT4TC_13140 [Myxococcaceae bacterium]
MSRLGLVAAAVVFGSALGCGSSTVTTQNGTPDAGEGSVNGLPGDQPNGSGNGNGDPACAVITAEAKATSKKPVDIVMIVDNSDSMGEEIDAVKKNINTSFADILAKSGLDYQVILLSRHGSFTSANSIWICITKPLSGADTCDANSPNYPPEPVFVPNQFYHYSWDIGSNDSLSIAINNWAVPVKIAPGWGQWLRKDAVKHFIEISDDNSTTIRTAAAFDAALLALSPEQFGTAQNRNYIFHSIVGTAPNLVADQAYQPTEAVVTQKCATAENPGLVYQDLSKLTGGLRYPVCNVASYDAVFKQVAQGVVDSAQVACEFSVPTPPDGRTIAGVWINYTKGGGNAVTTFDQVKDASGCRANSFYNDGTKLRLCADTCTTVKADAAAKLNIAFTCGSLIN